MRPTIISTGYRARRADGARTTSVSGDRLSIPLVDSISVVVQTRKTVSQLINLIIGGPCATGEIYFSTFDRDNRDHRIPPAKQIDVQIIQTNNAGCQIDQQTALFVAYLSTLFILYNSLNLFLSCFVLLLNVN